MNSETNTTTASSSIAAAHTGSAVLDPASVAALRQDLHELANILTGLLIAGGLLSMKLESGSLQRYATEICESSERGCLVIQSIRRQVLTACGETEVASSIPF